MSEPLLSADAWTDRLFSDGWVKPSGGVIAVQEPATETVLTQVGRADRSDVARAAASAKAAQPAWAALTADARQAILLRAADLLVEHAPDLAPWIMRESGSVAAKAAVELEHAAGFVRQAGAMATEAAGLVLPSSPGKTSIARRVPLGVVAVISPFNFPLVLSIRAVAPALATGNAVVLKPDPRTPISGGFLIARVFEAAGLPAGLLHVLPGDAEAGDALCRDPNIAMVAFTGSTGAGRKVGEVAGAHLKKVALELGGKNPLIILDDADPDVAASNAAWGAWLHQGQVCMTAGRLLVQRGIHDAVVERLAAKAGHLPVGDPMRGDVALGPLISRGQLDRVHAIVSDTVADGARLVAGGTHKGLCYAPTVLTGVAPGMRAFEEEIFGPIAAVTVFDDLDEAARLANDGPYGLSAGIISGSVGRAMTLGAKLEVGHLHINDQTVDAGPHSPFGGMKASGNGTRISGPANLDEFTTWRWETVKAAATAYPF
ncbi:benzaldehyde dehydrogenase [Caulobacter vibrioides]|uniref:Benzaldehyde dehydrogenase n=2 Tax=Caulobacter vibrioides TaxID=155892 RepID=Q9A5Q0_CAUVC|nr:benzaldehyde dehydrogenase [Caulobacter vibrioides]YP_002517853.1 NAD-dependent benzaldehyde dehydrogenase II [Caulobacter vibrioides NA1000]AAK24368.1 benzaldehyde dehydrogenase [Caulobacter vibrioides CB15]ACL95945.1 NAD-dependent benzaldehyde dehydrogenase II [Caulobacter vibrioides NA1000]ATC30677.1 benzaldehyde dehydrogenase [Caulobacter vibrioides]QXZ53992.1 benzaldehyde dehydrogenase [Caulobacter vibrioides]